MSILRLRPVGFVEPCLPTRTACPPSGPEWVHEIKHDGFRLVARKGGDGVRPAQSLGARPLGWCIMLKLTTVTASIFLLAACDTTESIKREQLEQLERAKAEIEAYSEIDDAKCR